MACYYHPERKSTDNCAICGKSICKECGLEIAGKTYCKDCLEKIVGIGIENKTAPEENIHETPIHEPTHIERRPELDIEEVPYSDPNPSVSEVKEFPNDSPYNIHYQEDYQPEPIQETPIKEQIPQNEYDIHHQTPQAQSQNTQEFIYPDHQFDEPRSDLEDKYEKYLNDLYYDENELPLNEQLAKDEEQYGSLTRRPYAPRTEEALLREQHAQEAKKIRRIETPEEMEARIRAEILAEQKGNLGAHDTNIHNINYNEENNPNNVVDIVLSIILVIIILIVIYYLIYIIVLQSVYPTFMDAVYGLTSPQTVIDNIFNPPQI